MVMLELDEHRPLQQPQQANPHQSPRVRPVAVSTHFTMFALTEYGTVSEQHLDGGHRANGTCSVERGYEAFDSEHIDFKWMHSQRV